MSTVRDVPSTASVAVITGAARGLGAAIAGRFADAQLRLVLVDRDEPELARLADELRDRGAAIATVVADLRDDDAPARVVDAAVTAFDGVDVLVNNAGIVPFRGFLETTAAELDELLAINVGTPFRLAQAVARRMLEQGRGGSVVNVGSVHALVGVGRTAAYAASKGAIHALTRSLAVELGPSGVRCNTLVGGTIMTERVAGALTQATLQSRLAQIPAGRVGVPLDIAEAALFLAGPGATFITGQEIVIDGGFTAFGDH